MPRARNITSLGPLESQLMQIAWASENVTVRQAFEILNRRLAYTTLMTIMGRLTKKGMLVRRRVGRSFVYRAKVKEDDFRGRSARMLASSLLKGFDHVAIASFVEEVENIAPERLAELRELVKEAAARHERKG